MENKISLTVNGQPIPLTVNPDETLADTLRKRLKLTGTKIGCEEAECGICTVLVDGEPTLSCTYPAARADGKDILTIEGLANTRDGKLVLHPLQEAFVQHGAVQCGFCIPGQIMTSYALIKRNPNPSSDELRHALKDTLCRCAGYPTIENAILDAAKALRTGEPISQPQIPDSIHAHKVIGKNKIRPDAIEKVTGDALYTDDLVFDNMLFAHVRRAGVPHAFLKSLDITKAQNLPGVVAVLTAEDIPGEQNHGLVVYDWPTMVGVGERVRYVGDALAIVAAETQEIAEQAVALIEAEFEPQTVDHKMQSSPTNRTRRSCTNPVTCSNTSKSARAIWTRDLPKRKSSWSIPSTRKSPTMPSLSRNAASPCRSKTVAWKFTSARRSRIRTARKWRACWAGRRSVYASLVS